MSRARWALAGAAVVVAGASAAAVTAATSSGEPAAQAEEQPGATMATVERGPLASMVSEDGTLTYRASPDGTPYVAINQASGTYTDLPRPGEEVGCGDVLYRVDDEPVLLLCGTVPAYRALEQGDRGRDVRQLNRTLDALGYDVDRRDDDFTWQTREALTRLQDDRGFDDDDAGTLDRGDVVVLPRAVRVAKVGGRLGGPAHAGAPVLQATTTTLQVQVALSPSQQDQVRKGDRARITLPGSRPATGRVERLGSAVRTDEDDPAATQATIPAYVRLDRPRQARGLDAAPVQVEITTEGVKDALSVPVTALVGKAGGGYAVEVVRAGGRRELVAVDLGLFDTAAGRVQVEGQVAEGDRVVVPTP